ncbi:MAG TPA: LpqB family beta-propeller domain-containing protein [Gammaproteobacteria bacterium]|nr:LpqB family beta-propeller domain-containing protein [Gammaproteobacteria bacterium]
MITSPLSLQHSFVIPRCLRCTAALILSLVATAVHADIIFTAKVMGPVTSIYAVDESGNLKKITADERWRDMDPDRRKGWVTFSSDREKDAKIDMYKTSEDYNVYVIKDNGKSLRKITDSPYDDVVPKLSPDTKYVGYVHQPPDQKQELRVVKRGGGRNRVLATADTILDLSWSPDGKSIAYAPAVGTDSMLMTVDMAGGEPRSLVKVSIAPPPADAKDTEGFLTQIVSVQWSPDGEKIAYIRHPLKQGAVRELHVFNLKTGANFRVSDAVAQVQHPIVWSADSSKLLYSALIGYRYYYDEKTYKKVYEGGMEIFLSTLEGDKVTTLQLTKGDDLFKSPTFSPDEKRIAFLYADALEERTLSLRIMNLDGTDMKELYNSVAQRSYLQWK